MKRKLSGEKFYRLLNKRLSQIASLRLEVLRESTETIVQESSSRGMREDSLRQFQAFFQKAIPAGITSLLEEVERHFELDHEVPFDLSTIKELIVKSAANWFTFAEHQYRNILSSMGMPELYDRIQSETVTRYPIRIQDALDTGLLVIEATINSRRSKSPVLQVSTRRQPKVKGTQFPTPPGTKWEDVKISLETEHTIEITINRIRRKHEFTEMGFRDARRKEAQPRKSWELLSILAEHGRIKWTQGTRSGVAKQKREQEYSDGFQTGWVIGPTEENFKKQMQDLSETLRSFFDIQENPFHPYSKTNGWEPRFKITRSE